MTDAANIFGCTKGLATLLTVIVEGVPKNKLSVPDTATMTLANDEATVVSDALVCFNWNNNLVELVAEDIFKPTDYKGVEPDNNLRVGSSFARTVAEVTFNVYVISFYGRQF